MIKNAERLGPLTQILCQVIVKKGFAVEGEKIFKYVRQVALNQEMVEKYF